MSEPSVFTTDSLALMRAVYPSLPPSERKVVDFLLSNFEEVIRMTLADLAQASGVSDATVVRLCRSLGFNNFLELKISLTRSIADTPRMIHDDVTEGDSSPTVARKVLRTAIQAVQDTLEVLDDEAFDQAVSLLNDADRILIAGVGTSGPLAHELYNRLIRLRMNCHVHTDIYLQVVEAALMTERDVVLLVSQNGTSAGPIRTAKTAREKGAKIIVITGNRVSELSELADIILLTVSHETRLEAIDSRVAQHALIQSLYVALAMRRMASANESERLIWEALLRTPISQAL
ncbi:MAG: MurR/RpiR family transcriptional regulator [Chloroflexi bacterium]|nr:MurR/RpiR family transcriptional regulator [Chloroflexota bacterium]